MVPAVAPASAYSRTSRAARLAGGLLGALALATGITLAARARSARQVTPPDHRDEVVLQPFVPPGAAGLVVALDPGHGAPGNTGNRSCLCEREEDFTMRFTLRLAAALSARGLAPVLLRAEGERVPYSLRLQRAVQAGARALVSLHSDIRGTPEPATWFFCGVSEGAAGFSVLYSDERGAETADDLALARSVARELSAGGFTPYDGASYAGSYARDAEPGVFVDRHAPEKRLFLLRTATMPAVLVETHHALDPEETALFARAETAERFAGALERALRAQL